MWLAALIAGVSYRCLCRRCARRTGAHLNRVSTIGELTASLAHEIKQPIVAAVANAQACLQFLDGGRLNVLEARGCFGDGQRRHACDIIDRVRSLYQKGSSDQEMVDVNDVIREMIAMLRDEANRHSVITCTDLAEGLPNIYGRSRAATAGIDESHAQWN